MPVTGESGPRANLIYERLKQVSARVVVQYYPREQAGPGRVSRFVMLPVPFGCPGGHRFGLDVTAMPEDVFASPGIVFAIR